MKDSKFEDNLEKLYWEFDAARSGYGRYKLMPQSERDAFKMKVRGFVKSQGITKDDKA